MANQENLTVKISVEGKQASQAVGKFAKALDNAGREAQESSKQVAQAESAFSRFGKAAIQINQALELVSKAYNTLANAISVPLELYKVQEAAETSVRNSLKLTGQFTEEAAQQWFDYASALQENSTIGDETTLQLVSMATAMGKNREQTEDLINASAELAAVTGRDVKTAFNTLIQTFAGTTTTLKRMGVDLSFLTKEQLEAGEGVKFIAREYEGFAKAMTGTVAGSIQQTSNLFGDMQEEIGKTFAELTGLAASQVTFQRAIIATIGAIQEFRSDLQELIASTQPVRDALYNAFVAVDWKQVLSTIGETVKFVAIAFSAALIPSLISLTPLLAPIIASLGTMAVSMTVLAAKAAILVSAVVGIDLAFRNFDKLIGSISVLWSKFVLQFQKGVETLLRGKIALKEAFGADVADDQRTLLANLQSQVQTANDIVTKIEAVEDIEFDFGLVGDIFEQGRKAVDAFNGTLDGTVKTLEVATESAKSLSDALPKERVKPIDQKEIDAAVKAFDSLVDAQSLYGLNAEQTAEKVFAKRMKEIDALEEQLRLVGELTGRESELARAREIASEQRESGRRLAGPAPEFVSQVQDVMTPITETIQGFGSVITGPVAAAQAAISAGQAIVDAVPQLLNSAANLINSLTDLPNVLLEGIQNLLRSVPRFIAEFIPNIINAIPELAMEFVNSLVAGIPNAVVALVDGILNGIDSIVARIPEFAQKLIAALISGIPKMQSAFIRLMVQAGPRLAIGLIKAAPDIAVGIVKGIIDGIKEIGSAFGSIFDFGSLGGDVADVVTQAGESIVSSVQSISEETFRVLDLGAQARGLSLSDDISDAIESSTSRAASFLRAAWDVAKNIFGKIVSDFRAMFDFVLEGFGIVFDVAKGIFTAVIDLFTELWNSVKMIFDGVVLAFEGVFDIFKAVGQFVVELFQDPIGAFKNLFDNVFNAFGKIVSGFKGVFDGFLNGVKGAFNFLGDIGKVIFDGFKNAISSVGNLLKKLFTFDGGGRGAVEKFLGFDFPFVAFAEGGRVPGMPKVAGDSLKNDIIPAMLSPGEVVIPRSAVSKGFEGVVAFLSDMGIMGRDERGRGGQPFFLGKVVDTVGSALGSVASGVSSVFGGLADNVIAAYDAITSIGGNVDFARLFTDPIGAIKDALRGMTGFLKEIFEDWMKSNLPGFQTGGFVTGYGGNDSTMAMLSPGEFVLNRSATARLGTDFLDRVNRGQTPMSQGNQTINLTINTTQQIDEAFIRGKLIPEVKRQLKRDSLDGRRVLSPTGVR